MRVCSSWNYCSMNNSGLILNTKKVAWKVKTMTAFFVAQNEEKENEKHD